MARSTDHGTDQGSVSLDGTTDLERAYSAVVTGDLAAAQAICTPDVVLRVPGRSRLAGDYRGPAGVAVFFESVRDLADTVDITIEHFAVATGRAVATQKLVARRGGRGFSDRQNVLLMMADDKVREISVYPRDLRVHDEFWDRTPLLTQDDQELLARAIRTGRSAPPDPDSDRKTIAAALVALLVLTAIVAFFNWLFTTRYSQRVVASSTDIRSVRHLTVKDPAGSAEARILPAEVDGVAVTNPFGGAVVALPIPARECARLAQELGRTCNGRTISAGVPFSLHSSRRLRLTTTIDDATRIDFGFAPEEGSSTPLDVDLVARTTGPPEMCLSAARPNFRLSLTSYGRGTVPYEPAGDAAAIDCDEAVLLKLGNQATSPQVSAMSLAGASRLRMSTVGATSEVDGLAGKLTLVNVSTRVFDPATHVVVTGDPPVETSIDLGAVAGRLEISSPSVDRILTDEGDLLPTRWQLFPQPFAAMVGALFGTLILPDLAKGLFLVRDRYVPRAIGAVQRVRRRRRRHDA